MRLPFITDNGLGRRAALGLIALQADETVEDECRRLTALPDVALFCSRVACDARISPQTLTTMKAAIPVAAALLPQAALAVVGYACTSGATIIGEDETERLIRAVHPQARVTNPLTAAKAACQAMSIRRLAYVSPYTAAVSAAMRTALTDAGIAIAGVGSYQQSDDRIVAKITPASCLQGIIKTARAKPCDGVFISCTNLRALSIIQQAERLLGIPVISSNQALAWHMLRLAKINDPISLCGKLLTLPATRPPIAK